MTSKYARCLVLAWLAVWSCGLARALDNYGTSEFDQLRKKLDDLHNIQIIYQLHNKFKSETRLVTLSIRDFRTFRLETDGLVYIVNNGDMIFYGGKNGNHSNVRKVQEDYLSQTKAFWTDNEALLQRVLGDRAKGMAETLRQGLIYPSILLRVTRAANYTPQDPVFSFSVSAGLVTAASYYSWVNDMEELIKDPQIDLQVYPEYLAVKHANVEFWVYRDSGLLHTQKLILNNKVEASLTAQEIKRDMKFDDALFRIKAPADVKVQELDQFQTQHLFVDMQSGFVQQLGRQLAARDLAAMTQEQKSDLHTMFQKWLDTNFEVFLPVKERDHIVQTKVAEYQKQIAQILGEHGTDKERARSDIHLLQAEVLQVVKRIADEMDDSVRSPLSGTIKSTLKQVAELSEANRKTLYQTLNGALTTAYGLNFEMNYLGKLKAQIETIARAEIKKLQ